VIAALLVACGGFLLAVLWMDLMFDVMVFPDLRGNEDVPEEILASIAAYYRRVTTTASPMGHLVGAVMATLLASLVVELVGAREPRAITLASLALASGPIGLAIVRVVPNAVRLGARTDSLTTQSALARSICRDHLFCFAAILAFVVLRLAAA